MDAVASALVTSKVKGLTKDIENMVGLNEDDKHNEAVAEGARIDEQRRREKELEKRRREREARRQERETERDNIRAKYQLPTKGTTTSSTSKTTSSRSSDQEGKNCIVS